MKLHCHPASITSRPVRLFIAEKGLDVEEVIVDIFVGEHHQPAFIAKNPSRLVPVLEDGDLLLTESCSILRYLAQKFDLPEYPKELKAQARVNEVMDWTNINFYRDWGYNLVYPQLFPHHKRPSDEGQRVTNEWGLKNSHFWFDVLNTHWLGDGRKWLTGDKISIADYSTGSIVALGNAIRWDLAKYPNVARWKKNVEGLKNWGKVSEVLDGYHASLAEQEFIR